jgi:hypothetical protein
MEEVECRRSPRGLGEVRLRHLGAVGCATALAFAAVLALAAVVAALAAALAFTVVLAFTGMLGGVLIRARIAEARFSELRGTGLGVGLRMGGNRGSTRKTCERSSQKQCIQLIFHCC